MPELKELIDHAIQQVAPRDGESIERYRLRVATYIGNEGKLASYGENTPAFRQFCQAVKREASHIHYGRKDGKPIR